MQLVQILLPLYDNDGVALPRQLFARVRDELTTRFGGLTAHTSAPAEGVWQPEDGTVAHDEIVLFEVMTDELDTAWWAAYRQELERLFRQDTVVIRAASIRLL